MANGMESTRREETVRRILDGAMSVFAQEGFEGASVDDIAASAGVNKATIYYYIGDKEALYGQVLHRVISGTARRIADQMSACQGPAEKLEAYIRGIALTVEEHPPLPPVMMRAVSSRGANLPKEVAEDIVVVYGMLNAILEEGVAQGAFLPANALIVYLMVLSALALHKNVLFTWAESAPFLDMLKDLDDQVFLQVAQGLSGDAAGEVARLVLRAITIHGNN